MAEPTKDLNILFIDDEIDNIDAFTFNCEMFWDTHALTHPSDVLNGSHPVDAYDAVIVDLVFDYPQDYRPDLKIDPSVGLGFVEWMQKNKPQIPVMILSAFLTADIKATVSAKYPKVLCKDKPLDFSKKEFRKMMADFITQYRSK